MESEPEDDQEPSDFVCIECGADLGPDDTCEDEDCPLFGAEDIPQGHDSDAWLRQQERRQMGVTC